MSRLCQLLQRIVQLVVLSGSLVLVLVIGSPLSASAHILNVSSQQMPQAPGSLAYYLLSLINSDRASRRLPAYQMNNQLWAVAYRHNLLMAESCGLKHQCPGEPDPGTRISRGGVSQPCMGRELRVSAV